MRFEDGASAAAFDAKMRALFDARLRDGDLVLAGVDDVASHLLGPDDPADPVGTARDLVVFTEDVGLVLAFQGERAAALRDPGLGTLQAFVGLGLVWLPQTLLDLVRFDGVSVNRALTLALTDNLWRGFADTFSRLADDYDVWLIAATDVADARLSTDPVDVALHGDPEHPERTDVWLPSDANVWNQAVVFDPDGHLVSRTRKVYLTPPEEDPGLLNLSFGDLRDLRVVETAVGRLGIMISKDAWMADVVDRFDQLGADVIVQPDANPGAWASYLSNGPDVWYPDNWKAGNWAHVQRFPSIRHNVTPMMTGNLFDFAFDGQGSIVSDAGADDRRTGFVGQTADVGFRAVGSWAIADPGEGDPRLDLAARRAPLVERSLALAPGSGAPEENAYGESVIWADLAIPVRAAPVSGAAPVGGPSPRVIAPSAAAQWNPVLSVAPDGAVHAAWIDFRAGNADLYAAASADGGRTFGAAVRVDDGLADRTDHQDALWGGRLAAAPGGRVFATWTDFRDDSWEVFATASVDGGRTFRRPASRVDTASEVVTPENLLYDPAIVAGGGDRVFVVWSDGRSVSDADIVLRRSDDGGVTWQPEVRVDSTGDGSRDDERGPTGLGASQQWSPAIAVHDEDVVVAWQDFRDGFDQLYVARSTDGGQSFGVDHPIAPAAGFAHRYFPSLARDGAGTLYLAWQQGDHDGGDVWLARSDDGGASFGAPVRVDDAGDGFSTQSRPAVAVSVDGARVVVAWRDDRAGVPEVRFAVSDDRGAGFAGSQVACAARTAAGCGPPALALEPDGAAVLAWHRVGAGGVEQVEALVVTP